jgi:hypothetical protein
MATSGLLNLDPVAPPCLEAVSLDFKIVTAWAPTAVDALWDSERCRYWGVEGKDNGIRTFDGEDTDSKGDSWRLAVTGIRDSKIEHGRRVGIAATRLEKLTARAEYQECEYNADWPGGPG